MLNASVQNIPHYFPTVKRKTDPISVLPCGILYFKILMFDSNPQLPVWRKPINLHATRDS